MVDFYISELSEQLEVEDNKINYINSQDILIDGVSAETLLSKRNLSIKKIFRSSESRVLEYLKEFKCQQNLDVEDFLSNGEKAIRMQKESRTRTYLIVDSENKEIAAYFAISFKPIILDSINIESKTMLKKFQTHKNKSANGNDIEIVPTILIGQIGKNDDYSSENINLKIILEYVFSIINPELFITL